MAGRSPSGSGRKERRRHASPCSSRKPISFSAPSPPPGRLGIILTRVSIGGMASPLLRPKHDLIESFASRTELIESSVGSAHLPFFLNGRATRSDDRGSSPEELTLHPFRFRDRYYVDGMYRLPQRRMVHLVEHSWNTKLDVLDEQQESKRSSRFLRPLRFWKRRKRMAVDEAAEGMAGSAPAVVLSFAQDPELRAMRNTWLKLRCTLKPVKLLLLPDQD
eukprot:scaffold1373_cov367-Pinguiococcus_pyrenoidosus.AAC.31